MAYEIIRVAPRHFILAQWSESAAQWQTGDIRNSVLKHDPSIRLAFHRTDPAQLAGHATRYYTRKAAQAALVDYTIDA